MALERPRIRFKPRFDTNRMHLMGEDTKTAINEPGLHSTNAVPNSAKLNTAAFAATRLSPSVRVELNFFDRLTDLHNHLKEIISNHLKHIGMA